MGSARIRIDGIRLKNFLVHEETDLDLRAGNLLIFNGGFGDGKSSIRDAVRYALTGSCRDTLVKDASVLIYDPVRRGGLPEGKVRRMKVEIDFAPEGRPAFTLERHSANVSHTKANLERALGRDPDHLLPLLSPMAFAELGVEAKIQFIDKLLGAAITDGELTAAGVDDPETMAQAKRSIALGRACAAKKKRACAAAARGSTHEKPADPIIEELNQRASEVDAARFAAALEGGEKRRDELFADVERAKGLSDARIASMEKAVTDARARLAAATAARTAKAAAIEERARQIERALPKAKEALAVLEKTVADLAAIREDATSKLSDVRSKAEAAERAAGAGPCVLCGSEIPEEKRAALREAADDAARVFAEVEKEVADAESSHEAAARERDKQATIVATHEKNAQTLREARAAADIEVEEAEKAIAAATRDLEAVRASAVSAEELQIKIDRLEVAASKLEKARAIQSKLTAYRAALAQWVLGDEARKRHETDAARFERMEEALCEGGAVAVRVSNPIANLRARVEAIGETVCPPHLRVGLDETVGLLINGASWTLGSTGERFVASALLGAALAIESGIGFLFLDDMSSVDPQERGRVMSTVLRLADAGEMGQVFCFMLREMAGWCDTCDAYSVGLGETMRCSRECGGSVGATRPHGKVWGKLRVFSFAAPGKVEEVMPRGGASKGAA